MTAQYTTRFFKPLPLEKDVLYCSKINIIDGSKISLKAKLIDETKTKYASARGLFILQDMEKFKQMNLEAVEKVSSLAQTHQN